MSEQMLNDNTELNSCSTETEKIADIEILDCPPAPPIRNVPGDPGGYVFRIYLNGKKTDWGCAHLESSARKIVQNALIRKGIRFYRENGVVHRTSEK